MYRVIISHNQTASLHKFPGPVLSVVVLDAPTDNDIATCHSLGYAVVIVPQYGNRGSNRNAGLDRVLAVNENSTDIVEFLDGDRYPISPYSTDLVKALMLDNHLDCLLYTCSADTRLSRLSLDSDSTYLVDTGSLCNPFYSCGFAMSVSAIRKIMEFNGGYLFEPAFTGWGCEDQYLGMECSHLGLRVGITTNIVLNGSVGGTEETHQEYRNSLQTYVDLVRSKGLRIQPPKHPKKF